MAGKNSAKEQGELRAIIIATGSEIELAMNAYTELTAEGLGVRVVSMPQLEVFAKQEINYRDSVLPPQVRARVAVEASHIDYWYKFVGLMVKSWVWPPLVSLPLPKTYSHTLTSPLRRSFKPWKRLFKLNCWLTNKRWAMPAFLFLN